MKLLHILVLLLVVAIWGVNFVAVKIGLQEIPPLFLCFCRFFFLCFPAVFFFKLPPKESIKGIVLYGLVMFVLQFALLFTGMHMGVTAGLSSILLQMQVFFSIFFASLILKEKLNFWQISGALLSFSGIVLSALKMEAKASILGFFFVLAASATWGGGSVMVKKMGKISSPSLLIWGSMVAWPPLLFLSLAMEEQIPMPHQLTVGSYGAILFIILASTAFGFGTWNKLLQIYPLATIAPFTLLVPIFGMVGATLFLNEPLESWKILAAFLVVGGLCINLLGPRIFKKEGEILMKP